MTVIPLHLRPGAREWFFTWLEREHPELVPRYRRLYRRGAYVPAEYRDWLRQRVRPLLDRYGFGPSAARTSGRDDDELEPSQGRPGAGVPGDPDSEYPEGSLPRRFSGPMGTPTTGRRIVQPTLL